jgi:hypothetical protein
MKINSPCLENGFQQLNIASFIDNVKEVLTVEAINVQDKDIRKEGEKIRDFCLDDETSKRYPIICNNTPPEDAVLTNHIPEDTFVPRHVKYDSEKYGHPAMLGIRGLMTAAATTGLMGYSEYNARTTHANQLVMQARMAKEMNALYSQQSIYQQTYHQQMAQNYYSMMNTQNQWGSNY